MTLTSFPLLPQTSNRLAGPLASHAFRAGTQTQSPFHSFTAARVQSQAPAITKSGQKQARTKGMKVFDTLLYPLLTNFAVTALSVFFTYQTSHGNPKKFLFGGDKNWFMKRGESLRGFFEKWMSKESAKNAVMVFFSFLDGSLMAPVVKMFEDHRNDISKWFDQKLGTTPKDLSVYEDEPKQSWGSLLAGRAAAAGTIVPVAILLNRLGGEISLNDRLLNNPGAKLGAWVKDKFPIIQRTFKGLNIPGLFKTLLFEVVYTALTTTALYFSSRFFATQQKASNTQR